jgi:hypothetical protein
VHTADEENVSATLVIAVPAERVFAVLADPAAHSAIDGTGWVQEAADQAPLTAAGQLSAPATSATRCTTWPGWPPRRPWPARPASRHLAGGSAR